MPRLSGLEERTINIQSLAVPEQRQQNPTYFLDEVEKMRPLIITGIEHSKDAPNYLLPQSMWAAKILLGNVTIEDDLKDKMLEHRAGRLVNIEDDGDFWYVTYCKLLFPDVYEAEQLNSLFEQLNEFLLKRRRSVQNQSGVYDFGPEYVSAAAAGKLLFPSRFGYLQVPNMIKRFSETTIPSLIKHGQLGDALITARNYRIFFPEERDLISTELDSQIIQKYGRSFYGNLTQIANALNCLAARKIAAATKIEITDDGLSCSFENYQREESDSTPPVTRSF